MAGDNNIDSSDLENISIITVSSIGQHSKGQRNIPMPYRTEGQSRYENQAGLSAESACLPTTLSCC